jgi:hypothetical protein
MSGYRRLSLFLLAALAVAVAPGCPTLPDVVSCGQIPPGGCPVGRGGSCLDDTCDALYACVNAVWVADQVCGHADAGAGGGGVGGAGGGLPDAGACTPVVVPANEYQSCTPDLQAPDCPIEAAGACQETACLSGCLDFYSCPKSLTWTSVAYCDDDGQFVGN